MTWLFHQAEEAKVAEANAMISAGRDVKRARLKLKAAEKRLLQLKEVRTSMTLSAGWLCTDWCVAAAGIREISGWEQAQLAAAAEASVRDWTDWLPLVC